MNPIPTTKAMAPAPGKGISSYPTPVIKDTIIVEVVNAWKGDYVPLEYGAKWDDHPHASQQGSYPDHKLISQAPNSEDGQWVKRIWANDRVDQDTYNYAIKYSGGSDAHPIYIRTYLEPRDTYAPRLDNSPDPLFPSAVLVDEEVTRTEGEFDSRYVQVTRVYETLPGPVIPTKRINERGDLETVNTQTVPPNTNPDPDGILVTQTQVVQEEVSKGVKTTATVPSYSQLLIKEKKEGLLGETVTTDDIVDPLTSPDSLSQTIVASVVQQTSKTKAVKRTTTASGPTSLTKKSNEGKLLSDLTLTRSIVAPKSNPDSISQSVLSSEVEQIDSGKAQKNTVTINSNPTLTSKKKSNGLMGNTRTVESIVPAGAEADTLNTVILESTVESINSSISKKSTTSQEGPTVLTGRSRKEGLLGETVVTESIVTAATLPDTLSQTVVSSTVEPIDSAKSKKTTITSTSPTSLTTKSKDGKLLGDITVTESIVAPGADPDPISGITSGRISSEVKQLDSGKAVKRNVVLNSTPTLLGSEKKSGLLGETTTTEIVVQAGTSADQLTESIISSTVEPIDENRSRKITQTSSGPTELSGKENKPGLLGETIVTKSIVKAEADPDSLSIRVISSTVVPIDSAKSEKTTVTSDGPTSFDSYKNVGGLLGEQTIKEEIVAVGTEADALSLSVLSSEVTPIDSQKSKRTTVESLLKELSSTSLVETPLGLVEAEIEKQIVPQTEKPEGDLRIIKSSIESIDSAKSEKEQVTVTSWPTNTGVDYDEQIGVGVYYTETIVDPDEYKNPPYWEDLSNISYKPIDQWKSFKKEINKQKVSAALLAQWYKISTDVQVSLPDKLLDVTVYWGSSVGQGDTASIDFSASTGSYSASQSSSSKNSASINGDVYFNIQQGFQGALPGYQHIFFMEIGSDGKVAAGDILNTLNNFEQFGQQTIPPNPNGGTVDLQEKYKRWPYIQARTENIVLISGGKSETINLSQSQSVNINGFGSGNGEGGSFDVDVNARSINIPQTLHESITIKEETLGTIAPSDLAPTYGVRPATLNATKAVINGEEQDAPRFPAGEYLYSSNVELYKWGFVKVTAITVEITENYT